MKNELKNETINQAIAEIYNRRGELKPSIVVEESKPKSSPLHAYFEWNDKAAGHQFRLMQARKIIRTAVIKTNGDTERFVHVPSVSVGEGAYRPMSVVVQSIDDFSAAMTEAVSKMSAAQRAVEALEAAASDRDDDTMAKIGVALKSLEVAKSAVETLH